jgi:hypothetical protein
MHLTWRRHFLESDAYLERRRYRCVAPVVLLPIGCPVLWSCVGHAPNRPASIVGDEQRAVLHYCQGSGASPHLGPMLTRDPETGHEVFVTSLRPTILEAHPNDLVAGWLRTVPGTLERYKCIPTAFCRELFSVVEHQIQNRRMRLVSNLIPPPVTRRRVCDKKL